MIYGYVRVSTKEQNLDRQVNEIRERYGDIRIYADKQSGKDFRREAYQELKRAVCSGDEVIIKELDRLGRNKEEVKKELEWFRSRRVICRILDVPTTLIDFKGQEWLFDMVNNILIEVMGSIAEQERVKIRSRQREGIDAALKKGVKFGRPKAEVDIGEMKERVERGEITVSEAVKELNISRRTWYRCLTN